MHPPSPRSPPPTHPPSKRSPDIFKILLPGQMHHWVQSWRESSLRTVDGAVVCCPDFISMSLINVPWLSKQLWPPSHIFLLGSRRRLPLHDKASLCFAWLGLSVNCVQCVTVTVIPASVVCLMNVFRCFPVCCLRCCFYTFFMLFAGNTQTSHPIVQPSPHRPNHKGTNTAATLAHLIC